MTMTMTSKAIIPIVSRIILLFAGIAVAFAITAASQQEQQELKIEVYAGPTVCDTTDTVKVGDRIGIHYVGTIDESSATGEGGFQFDSSRDRGLALEFTIGYGDVIDGWDRGLPGLCVGAKAILVVPPHLAYGEAGAGRGKIPGGATLRFDVEVMSVAGPPPVPDLFGELDVDGDDLLSPEEIRAHFRKEKGSNPVDVEIPPNLMANEDANGDGFLSREEFGGPRMPRDICMEMLHSTSDAVTAEALAVQWVCQRPSPVMSREEKEEDNEREDVGVEDGSEGEL